MSASPHAIAAQVSCDGAIDCRRSQDTVIEDTCRNGDDESVRATGTDCHRQTPTRDSQQVTSEVDYAETDRRRMSDGGGGSSGHIDTAAPAALKRINVAEMPAPAAAAAAETEDASQATVRDNIDDIEDESSGIRRKRWSEDDGINAGAVDEDYYNPQHKKRTPDFGRLLIEVANEVDASVSTATAAGAASALKAGDLSCRLEANNRSPAAPKALSPERADVDKIAFDANFNHVMTSATTCNCRCDLSLDEMKNHPCRPHSAGSRQNSLQTPPLVPLINMTYPGFRLDRTSSSAATTVSPVLDESGDGVGAVVDDVMPNCHEVARGADYCFDKPLDLTASDDRQRSEERHRWAFDFNCHNDSSTALASHYRKDVGTNFRSTSGSDRMQMAMNTAMMSDVLLLNGRQYEIVPVGDGFWMSKVEYEMMSQLSD
jgi:hypothetical protein